MPTRASKRSVQIGLGGVTRRKSGDPFYDTDLDVPPDAVHLGAPSPGLLGQIDPPDLYIPAYQGHPDVGLTNPDILTDYTGSSTIPSGTYVNKRFTGQHDTVESSTFDNCHFIPEGISDGNYCVKVLNSARQYFTDCEFGKVGADCDRLINAYGGTYTAIRCNLHHSEDGFKLANGAVIRMCHVHDMWTSNPNPTPHMDCVQCESGGSNYLLEYNNFNSNFVTGSQGYVNAAVFIKADLGPLDIDGVVLHNNYLNHGGFNLFLRNAVNDTINTVVTDNIFGLDGKYGIYRVDTGTVATWSGNVDTNDDEVPYTDPGYRVDYP